MKVPVIDISIEAGSWPEKKTLSELAAKAVHIAADEAGLNWPPNAELSLLFTNDEAMAKINGDWRGKNKTTNVLSFPGGDIEIGQPSNLIIGDLVFALETVKRESQDQHKTFEAHLTHLMIHGFLHLFGYDHIEERDAERMEAVEVACLARLGINDPYAKL